MSASHNRQPKAPQRAENRKADKQKRWKRGGYSWQLLAWALMITDAFRANQAIAEDATEDKADPDLASATPDVDQVAFQAPNIAPEAPEQAPEAPQAPLAQPIIEEAAPQGGEPILHGPMVAAAEWTPEASHFSGWRPAEYERVEIHLPTGRIPLNPDLDFFEGLQDFVSQLGFEGGLEEMLDALNPAIAGIVELGVFFSEEALAPVAVWEVVDDTPEEISFWVGDQFDVDWIVQGAGLTDDGAPVVEQINGVGGAVVDQQISEDGKFIKNSAVLVDGQDWDGTLWVTGDYYEFNTIVQINLLWDNDTLTLVRLDDSGATSTEIIGGRNSQTNSAQIVDFNGRLALDEEGLQGEDRHHDNYVWPEEDEDALADEAEDAPAETDASEQAAGESDSDASDAGEQSAEGSDAEDEAETEEDIAEQESETAEGETAEDAADAGAAVDEDESAEEQAAAEESVEDSSEEETASDAGDDADAEETGPAAGVVDNAASDAMALLDDEDDDDSAEDGSDEPGAADQALADVAESDDDEADDEEDAETPVAAAPETPAPVEEEAGAESVDGETGEDAETDIAGDAADSDPAEAVEVAAADQGDAAGDDETAPGDADQGIDQVEPAAEAADAAEDAADDVAESASALMDEDADTSQSAPQQSETVDQATSGEETTDEETADEETGEEAPVEQQAAAEQQPEELPEDDLSDEELSEDAPSGDAQPEEDLAASEQAADEPAQEPAQEPEEDLVEEPVEAAAEAPALSDDEVVEEEPVEQQTTAPQDGAQDEAEASEATDEPSSDEPQQQVAAAAGAAETPSDPPAEEASADNGPAVEDDAAELDDAQEDAPGGGEAADQTTVAAIAENNDSDDSAETGASAEQEQAAAASADAPADDPEPDAADDDAKPVDRAQLRADMLASIGKGDADYTVDPDDPGSVNTGALIDAVSDGKSQSVLDMAANAQFEDVQGEPDQLILGDYSEHFSAIQFNDLVDLDDITMVVADTYSALMNLADPVDFASIVNGDHHQKNQSLMVGGVNTGGHGMSQQEFYELKQSSGPIKTVNGNFYEFNTIFQINIAFDIDEFFGVDDEDEVIGSGGMIQFNEAGIFENDARDDLFVGGNYTEYNMVLQVNAMEDSDTITQIRAVDWAKQADIAIDPITKHGQDGADGHGPQDTIKSAGVFDDTSAYSLSMDGQV